MWYNKITFDDLTRSRQTTDTAGNSQADSAVTFSSSYIIAVAVIVTCCTGVVSWTATSPSAALTAADFAVNLAPTSLQQTTEPATARCCTDKTAANVGLSRPRRLRKLTTMLYDKWERELFVICDPFVQILRKNHPKHCFSKSDHRH